LAANRGAKTAIITGGSRGIGAAIASRLATDGFNIAIGYSSADSSDADLIVERARAAGVCASAHAGDVADPTYAKAMFDVAEAEYGGVDVLVNNAGVMILGRISDMDDIAFDREVAVNLKGAFNFMREAARRIREGGRIINISTSAVGSKRETYGVYAATKAAVELLSQVLAREMRGRQISVNAVAPGATATKLLLDGASPEFLAQIAKSGPYERLGTPEDIAATVGFLCSDGGAWINGQVIRVNGGTI
jgi:3-oxoacyl-[acyl-carrier protein] reductase